MLEQCYLRKGMVVRAPWREFGDDANLTGVVVRVKAHSVEVRWNGDGDVTPAGDASFFERNGTKVEVVEGVK